MKHALSCCALHPCSWQKIYSNQLLQIVQTIIHLNNKGWKQHLILETICSAPEDIILPARKFMVTKGKETVHYIIKSHDKRKEYQQGMKYYLDSLITNLSISVMFFLLPFSNECCVLLHCFPSFFISQNTIHHMYWYLWDAALPRELSIYATVPLLVFHITYS